MKKRSIMLLLSAVVLLATIGLAAFAGGYFAYRSIQAQPVQAFSPTRLDLSQEKGILIASVLPDSPANEAGLKRGDILLAVDGEEVNSFLDLKGILDEKDPSDEVELSVARGDEQLTLTASLGEQDSAAFLGVLPCGPGFADGEFILRAYPGVKQLRNSAFGAYILAIEPDSPAEGAGLQEGECILSVDGEKVGQDKDLAELISPHKPGDEVELEVGDCRGGEARRVNVELGEHPEDSNKVYLGISYAPAPSRIPGASLGLPPVFFYTDPEHVQPFELPEGVSSGVLVGKVAEGGPADQAGLQKGDLITAIDGKTIKDLNPRDFAKTIQAHQPGDSVTLSVVRRGEKESSQTQTLEIRIVLAEDPDQPGKAYLGIQTMGFFQMDHKEDAPGNFHFELPDWLPFRDSPNHISPEEDFKPGMEI
jgi:S1-C subfamily serine protease